MNYTDIKIKKAQRVLRELADYIGILKLSYISPEFIEREVAKVMILLDIDIESIKYLLTKGKLSL